MNALLAAIRGGTERLGEVVIGALSGLGRYTLLCAGFVLWSLRPPWRWGLLWRQMEFIGVQSLPIVALTGFFSGAVMALQFGYYLHLFSADVYTGAIVGVVLTRELAPVFAALMVAGRCGSAMAAEIGTMRVTEQVDALMTLAVSPVQYLVVPRVWAAVVMMPLLTMVFNVIGALGAYVVGVGLRQLDPGQYLDNWAWFVDAPDLYMGLIKSVFFGFIVASVGCFQGYEARGGARGVGQATTDAVVIASVSVLVADYFLTAILQPILGASTFSVVGSG